MSSRLFKRHHALPIGLLLTGLSASCAHVEPHVARVDESDSHFRVVRDNTSPPSTIASAKKQDLIVKASHESAVSVAFAEPSPIPPAPAAQADSADDSQSDDLEAVPASVPVGSPYTLADVESLALSNNPTLRQAAATVGKARGLTRQVGLYPNPTIGYSANEVGNGGQAGQQGAFVSQTIVTGDKLELNRSVAQWEIQNAQWMAETQRLRVINGVRSQFYQVLGAQRRVEIGRRLVQVADAGLEAAEDLEAAKQVGRPDVLQARIQLNEVRIVLRNAEIELEAAWKQLMSLTGTPNLPLTFVDGELTNTSTEKDLESLFVQLCASSPELQAARARVARARTQIRRQEIQPIPNLQLQLGGAHDFSTGDPIANIQAGLPIPIFNRNQGNIEIAQSEYRRAISDLQRIELDLRNRAAATLQSYNQAQNQVELFSQEILPAAEENLELTETGYERGEFDLLRALTARRSYFEANLSLIESQVALRQAEVLLDGLLVSGGLTEVPDIGLGSQVDTGLRDSATGGQQ